MRDRKNSLMGADQSLLEKGTFRQKQLRLTASSILGGSGGLKEARSVAGSYATGGLHSTPSNWERYVSEPGVALWPSRRTGPRRLARIIPGRERHPCAGRANGLRKRSNPVAGAVRSPLPSNRDPC